MASFLHRLQAPTQPTRDQPQFQLSSPQTPKTIHRPTLPKNPNAPDSRYQLQQKCIYERALPGKAYVSAHINRLQHGFYESSATHERPLNNVYFVSVHFVFHPADAISHRFKSATIRIGVHSDFEQSDDPKYHWYYPPSASPRFLKHAPELMYGAVSPENLQWNFSLSSSLGVSQTPVSANLNPSGGVKASYKLYTMMSIQGSLRTLRSPLGLAYDVEDGLAVWTLEENSLQRSGLPREFDFVLLVHRPDDVQDMYLSVDVDSVVDAWFGHYPQWYMNSQSHQPLHRQFLDFQTEIGQKFQPSKLGRGFNFADLPLPLDDYVSMPGTTYPTNDTANSTGSRLSQHSSAVQTVQSKTHNHQANDDTGHRISSKHSSGLGNSSNRNSWCPDTLNVRVLLEHSNSQSPSSHRYSGSPRSGQEPLRHRSIRRSKSRTGLNEFSAQQAAHDFTRDGSNGVI
ncbi:hypothetical protein AOQ84DRAFT_390049 [Glonium stellatum]|uniref:Uncharacterized protein n=1 Tax=Glonium stellatum TaxID=574774 RepID=A0A8E2EXC6_9PEZI|nr:hypothetical protein AOQ84DRAFT_390049 [Glonium stellatum]